MYWNKQIGDIEEYYSFKEMYLFKFPIKACVKLWTIRNRTSQACSVWNSNQQNNKHRLEMAQRIKTRHKNLNKWKSLENRRKHLGWLWCINWQEDICDFIFILKCSQSYWIYVYITVISFQRKHSFRME